MWTVLHLGRFLPISRETTVQCLSCWWHKGPSYKNRLSLTSLEGVYWFRREFLAFHLPAGSDWKLEFRKVSVPRCISSGRSNARARREAECEAEVYCQISTRWQHFSTILLSLSRTWLGSFKLCGKLWMKGVWQRYDLEWIVKSYKKVLLAS